MKKLTRVKLINWHRFANTLLDFEQTTLISGENGAGKSTLLDAIQFVITCSSGAFNKAAHEHGKRRLTGYIRCKTGKESRPYERTGEISAHVALEFYEESRQKYFVIGAAIDSASVGQEKTVRYLMDDTRLDDSLFFNDKTPKSISQFRSSNGKKIKQWCTTDKDAKVMVKNRLGRIEDKFFRLIPKALAFRPIDDIKDFVYSYVLDEKAVNIDVLRENVRTYQDLLATLQNIKVRMEKLSRIEELHQKAETAMKKDDMYAYFLLRAEADQLEEELCCLEKNREHTKNRITDCKKDIEVIEKEKHERQSIRDHLYAELASDKDFIARDEQQKKLHRLEERYSRLKEEKKILMESVAKAKKLVKGLCAETEEPCFATYLDMLESIETQRNLASLTDLLENVMQRKNALSGETYKAHAETENALRILAGEVREWELKIESLKKKRMTYPKDVHVVLQAIQEEFHQIGRKSEPRVLCELLEIEDESWRDAVEGYLNTQRFHILVEPESFDIALGTYDRLRKERRAYGVGLINAKKLESYTEAPKGSLASVVTSDNPYARKYINMLLGKVMMCEHYSQLKQHKTAITKACMRYQNHVASALKPEVYETPYIGKAAIRVQLQQAEEKQRALKQDYEAKQAELHRLSSLQANLSTEYDTDIKYRGSVLREMTACGREIQTCRENIATLEKNSNVLMKQMQLTQLETLIFDLEQKLSAANRKWGELENRARQLEEQHTESSCAHRKKKEDYLAYGERYPHFLPIWIKEYSRQTGSKGFTQFYENYMRRRKANQTTMEGHIDAMKKEMVEYKMAHDFGAAPTWEGYDDFEAEYLKLRDSELLSYEGKVQAARQSAEEEFREQFLAKLQENMKTAQMEFKELNKALKDIRFSNDRYEFLFMPSKQYRHYYEMIMDDFNVIQGESIFSGSFHEHHKEVIDELFERLALDRENHAKVLDLFTDYRTYMDYDIRIMHQDDSYSFYSKVCEEKSGGETQTPFYVTVAASFVQLYKNGISKESAGLVMFDEAFNNMDDERIGGVLEFLRRLPLQILIAAPPDKIQYIGPYVEETLLVMTDDRVSFAERYYNGAI